MSIKIIDNIITDETALNNLNNYITSDSFPWYYSPVKSGTPESDRNNNVFQFCHMFYRAYAWRSEQSWMVAPILDILKPAAILRIKANLTTVTPSIVKYDLHTDVLDIKPANSNFKTAIYYVNTNNGYTYFDNGEEIPSVKNRLAIFDANLQHGGTSSTDTATRIVINFNYISSE